MQQTREQLIQEFILKMKQVMKITRLTSYSFNGETITGPQAHLLFRISKEKTGVSMKELAEQLCVTSGAITQFIDELVEKKLLVRKPSSVDRRTVKVQLSESALMHLEVFKQEYIKIITPRFAKLTDEELQQLTRLFDKIGTGDEV